MRETLSIREQGWGSPRFHSPSGALDIFLRLFWLFSQFSPTQHGWLCEMKKAPHCSNHTASSWRYEAEKSSISGTGDWGASGVGYVGWGTKSLQAWGSEFRPLNATWMWQPICNSGVPKAKTGNPQRKLVCQTCHVGEVCSFETAYFNDQGGEQSGKLADVNSMFTYMCTHKHTCVWIEKSRLFTKKILPWQQKGYPTDVKTASQEHKINK